MRIVVRLARCGNSANTAPRFCKASSETSGTCTIEQRIQRSRSLIHSGMAAKVQFPSRQK
jgi:hypothetical protein